MACLIRTFSSFFSTVRGRSTLEIFHGWVTWRSPLCQRKIIWSKPSFTPGKINMEPENTPLEKEKHLPNHPSFRFQPLILGGVYSYSVPAVHFFRVFFQPLWKFPPLGALFAASVAGAVAFLFRACSKRVRKPGSQSELSPGGFRVWRRRVLKSNHRCGKKSMGFLLEQMVSCFLLEMLCFTHLLEYPYVYEQVDDICMQHTHVHMFLQSFFASIKVAQN